MVVPVRNANYLEDFQDILTPSTVAQYLATKHWTCHSDKRFAQLWIAPADKGQPIQSVLLPRDPSFADFPKRWAEAVARITSILDFRLSDFAEQVASVHADLFFIRLDQTMSDGTIPLHQASKLLKSIDAIIRSAAISTYNPDHTGRGRVPDQVKEFLAEEVRMGHTKKGSFIITVAARLDDAPQTVDVTGAVSMPSFSRQVMSTLCKTLDATRRHVSKGKDFVDFDSAVTSGVRLPIVEALRSIGEAEGLKSVEMSFDWAASEPLEENLPDHIKLGRKSLDRLQPLEARLRRNEPDRSETIVGPVIELKRSEENPLSVDSGEVVIRADVDGRSRKVTVPLDGADYDWAIRAHRAKQPYVVSGILGKKGNSWWLLDEVSPDVSFLENHFNKPTNS